MPTRRKLSVSSQVVLALLLGALVGLFFGEHGEIGLDVIRREAGRGASELSGADGGVGATAGVGANAGV